MKNFRKKITMTAVLTAMVVTALAGCAKKFDATTYVKGSLDASFKNEISDQYAKLVDGGRDAIQKNYDSQIEAILDEMRAVGCSDGLVEQYRDMYIELYSKCKYTVSEAIEDKSTQNFTVNVTVEPLNLDMQGISEKSGTYIAEWMQSQDITDSEAVQAAAIEEMFAYMLPLFQERLVAPEYLEASVVEVHVNKGKNNLYEIPQKDLEEITLTATSMDL